MPSERDPLRDWHRLFGMLLTDFFTGLPFTVEVERDLSEQQQFLDVVIVRRGRGRLSVRLPDGLDDLAEHNLITFKSHHEALDSWAMKELIGHYVAYRKLVSPSPSELLPEESFRLYAVCARFPDNLSARVPWHERQAGVYHYQWGTDEIRVIVAGRLAREAHNAPLHLFSASTALIGFGQSEYQRRSERTSMMLGQLLEELKGEGFAMSYTMEDFERDCARKYFEKLSPDARRKFLRALSPKERRDALQALSLEERRDTLQALPPEERLAGLSAEEIRQYLEQLKPGRRGTARKPRRKQ